MTSDTKMRDGKLIFITGASRSGTTLMSFVLRQHAKVFGLKELHFFGPASTAVALGTRRDDAALVDSVAWILARQDQGILAARPNSGEIERARRIVDALEDEERTPGGAFAATVSRLARDAGKSIPCEQTPRNIYYAAELLRFFPNARIVHMMRDPRAVMASQKRRWQRRKLATDKSRFPLFQSLRVWVNYHPFTMAKLWNQASSRARALDGHERFTVVRFEDLLSDPETTVRGMCDRLGLEFHPAMLDVDQVNSSHQSSVGGARRGLHSDAVETWRKTLSPAETALTESRCADLMQQFGYKLQEQDLRAEYGQMWYRFTYPWHAAGVMLVNPRRAWIQLSAALQRRAGSS